MNDEEVIPPPPPGPPPFLQYDQLLHLARQGWLFIDLPNSLSRSVIDLLKNSSQYFRAPETEKKELYPSKLGTEFGYYPIVNEKEYITFRCRIHTDPKTKTMSAGKLAQILEASTAKAWHDAGILLYRILCDIARVSDLDISVWNDLLDGTLDMPDSEDQLTYALMRLFRYFPSTGHAEEHTDLGLLTLCVGDGTGLQVLDRFNPDRKNAWVNAPVGTHTAAILVGQTLKVLSAQSMNAGVHRVVGNAQGRQSIVFALRHSMRHDVDFSLFGEEGKLTPTELWKMIQAGKVNINTEKEKRDAQRAKFRARKLGAEAPEHAGISQG